MSASAAAVRICVAVLLLALLLVQAELAICQTQFHLIFSTPPGGIEDISSGVFFRAADDLILTGTETPSGSGRWNITAVTGTRTYDGATVNVTSLLFSAGAPQYLYYPPTSALSQYGLYLDSDNGIGFNLGQPQTIFPDSGTRTVVTIIAFMDPFNGQNNMVVYTESTEAAFSPGGYTCNVTLYTPPALSSTAQASPSSASASAMASSTAAAGGSSITPVSPASSSTGSSTGSGSSSSPGGSGAGAVLGDPHFIGLRGQSYQVHGIDGAVYSMVRDNTGVRINALFVFLSSGRCPPAHTISTACWTHPGSYLAEVGVRSAGGAELRVTSGAAEHGFSSVVLNGVAVAVGDEVTVPLDDLSLHYASTHSLTLSVGNYRVTLHNSDFFVNLAAFSVRDWAALASQRCHGLLGQTWRVPLHSDRLTALPIAGSVDDYAEANNELLGGAFVDQDGLVG